MASRRPEHQAPATELYSSEGAAKYASSSRMTQVQTTLSERCLELLSLPSEPCLLLDIGTGTGLAGDVLTQAGHHWVGLDISQSMLDEALERDVEGDVMLSDIGEGVPFRMGSFDGAVSVSAIQWLCNADKSEHNPHKRMNLFFETLYAALRGGAKAALQFYPENVKQIEALTRAAMRAGFGGGVLVDFPNSAKAKKYYLCLTAGAVRGAMPKPLGVEEGVKVGGRRPVKKGKKGDNGVSKKEWIIAKKERRRRQGHQTKTDSRYTGRKRRVQF